MKEWLLVILSTGIAGSIAVILQPRLSPVTKYIKLVVGVGVILAILSPIALLVKSDIDFSAEEFNFTVVESTAEEIRNSMILDKVIEEVCENLRVSLEKEYNSSFKIDATGIIREKFVYVESVEIKTDYDHPKDVEKYVEMTFGLKCKVENE